MKREFQLDSRREFFAQTVGAMAILGVIASQRSRAADDPSHSAFSTDDASLRKTDPKLIAYEEASRWKAPHAEANRIAMGPQDTPHVCTGNFLTA